MTSGPRVLNAVQSDALREMANIGSGCAATVLSQMTGLHVMIDVPRVCVAPFDGLLEWLPEAEQSLVVLVTTMLGDLSGDTYFLLPLGGARALADLLLGRPAGASRHLSELEQSSLVEAGNIVASSFMNALAKAVERVLLPSVPRLEFRTRRDWHRGQSGSDYILLVETRFHFDSTPEIAAMLGDSLRGAFVFAPNAAAFAELFSSLLGESTAQTSG
jgi:chemotaxis protein CheC